MKIQLTQQIIINDKHRFFPMLDELCFKSKNLYNSALYHIREVYNTNKQYLSYYDINKIFHSTKNIDYNNLPYIQCSQQVLRQVDKIYSSFFKALKSPKMKGKPVRIPKYKDKIHGRNIIVYTNQCFKLKNQIITLKVDKNKKIQFKTDKDHIQQVRIVPKGNHYVIELIYNKEYQLKENNNRFAAIDLGINNLATLTSNVVQSTIYDGRKIKSINQHYNKIKGILQSKLQGKKQTSKRIKHLTQRRNNKIKDYMHKVSCAIVNYMEANTLNTLYVGKNDGWKDSINIGTTNNQTFVSIPFNILINMLDYKCKLKGIHMILINEAYTSKCSFLDNEPICKHNAYKGKRVKRGLFLSNKGKMLNADINGAFNIMKKGIQKCNYDVLNLVPVDSRFVYNPVRIKVA